MIQLIWYNFIPIAVLITQVPRQYSVIKYLLVISYPAGFAAGGAYVIGYRIMAYAGYRKSINRRVLR